MKKLFDELTWYALGKKGVNHKKKHGNIKENKNVTNVQNILSAVHDDDYFSERWKELIK